MQVPILYELFGEVSITQFLILILLVLTVAYYVYATRHHGVWEKVGVPGPKPWPIIDHKIELSKGVDVTFKKWFTLYGKTFGTYGILPHHAALITKDLSLLKNILVKDFDNFVERNRPRKTTSSLRFGLTSSVGDRWRRTRHVTSPMFTGSRMKGILKHVCASAETLTQLAKGHSDKGQLVELKLFATKFATEVIARIAFGVESHAVSKEESEFSYYARTIIKFNNKFLGYVDRVYEYFPHIDPILRFFKVDIDFVSKTSDAYFSSVLESTIQERKNRSSQSNEKPRDLLDMLLNARVDDNDPRLNDVDSKTLNHDEIIGNSTMLILAGVETVSTAFQSLLYCLALHSEIQDKLIDEIDRVFPKGTTVDYEQLKELKYAEQVIYECLRLFPLISTILRVAIDTKKYGNITIPKGTYVQIPIGDIMKDPEHWPDPDRFDPERFSPENKVGRDPLAFMPFGYGPRICLGMRLAMAELKVILVFLLRDFKFTLSERTQPKKGEQLVMKRFGVIALRPAKAIELEVVPRG
uniref:Cytochrome P450 n=1 Tax=Arion vulgaris TaxID=1028688 RepID=A0A0B7AYM6_9EUPU